MSQFKITFLLGIQISDGSGTKNPRPARPPGGILAVPARPIPETYLQVPGPTRSTKKNTRPNTRGYFLAVKL